ncbi:hypothetical protein PGTUg99_003544 [Puccinia graminis f. sp. tritici]|uniref:Uncharacterized protein n=1 Tax=Puccinia graminis f. sp. tritici TaxID=56615 RepID=A0A5B0LZY0_PUCGR|nr:hypothetical protein PGTUg99_003544 [Puccinia graminis f. sp. tritici]
MPSSRSLGAAILLGVMPLIQDSYSSPVGGRWESSRDLGPSIPSSVHYGMSANPIVTRKKRSQLIRPRSSQAETVSQRVNQILGSSDIVPPDALPEPKEKPDAPPTGASGPEKAAPPTAEHKPQDKPTPDHEGNPFSQALGPNPPAKKDNGPGHEELIPHPIDDPSAPGPNPQPDGKPHEPHGDDHNGHEGAGGPPPKKDGPEEHPPPPPPPADSHKPVGHPEPNPLNPPHPPNGDEHPKTGPHGPEKAKTQTTEIAVIAGIRIERVDFPVPDSTPTHPPAPADANAHHGPKENPLDEKDHAPPPPVASGHDDPKSHPSEKDHPPPPAPADAHAEPKDHPPAPAAEHGHDHPAEKDHPEPKQVEIPGVIMITNDSKAGKTTEAGPRAIRITTDKLKLELLL